MCGLQHPNCETEIKVMIIAVIITAGQADQRTMVP